MVLLTSLGYPVWQELECFFVDVELELFILHVVLDGDRYLELLVEEVNRKGVWVVHIGDVPRLLKLIEVALKHAGARVVRDYAGLILLVQAHVEEGLVNDTFLYVPRIDTIDFFFVVVALSGLVQLVEAFAVDFQGEDHLGDFEPYIDIPHPVLTAGVIHGPRGQLLQGFPESKLQISKR